jgi:hypothetical protein
MSGKAKNTPKTHMAVLGYRTVCGRTTDTVDPLPTTSDWDQVTCGSCLYFSGRNKAGQEVLKGTHDLARHFSINTIMHDFEGVDPVELLGICFNPVTRKFVWEELGCDDKLTRSVFLGALADLGSYGREEKVPYLEVLQCYVMVQEVLGSRYWSTVSDEVIEKVRKRIGR